MPDANKHGNFAKANKNRNTVPERVNFPLTNFRRTADGPLNTGHLIPEIDEDSAIIMRNFDHENQK